MEGAKPLVQSHRTIGTVVAFEILVVEEMEVIVRLDLDAVFQDYPLESSMALGGRDAGVLQMEQGVDRVRRNDPVDEHAREIEQVLDRMHGKPGQRPDIDIVVVEIMDPAIQRGPMDQPMDQIEMHIADHRDDAHQRHAIIGMRAPTDVGQEVVGVAP